MSIDLSSMEALLSEIKAGQSATSGITRKPSLEKSEMGSFADALKQAIEDVGKVQESAHDIENAYIAGDKNISLHEVMISGQRADIAFQQMAKVKEKLVAAYKDIMNMSI